MIHTLNAQTQIQINDETGATQTVSLADFLLALPTYQHGKITINYKSYKYDSFSVVQEPKAKEPKVEKPKAEKPKEEAKEEQPKGDETATVGENVNPNESQPAS